MASADGQILTKKGSSRKVGGANKGFGEALKSCTRKEHESATNSIAKRGQGGTSSLFVCPLQGQGTASLVGFGATPQLFRVKPTQRKKSTRRRQRSVPASNFARPQTRPQAALAPRFREEPKNFAAGKFLSLRRILYAIRLHCTGYFAMKFTRRPGTKMTFVTFLPARIFWISGSCWSYVSARSFVMSAGIITRPRTLPQTCTAISISDFTSASSSHVGHF